MLVVVLATTLIPFASAATYNDFADDGTNWNLLPGAIQLLNGWWNRDVTPPVWILSRWRPEAPVPVTIQPAATLHVVAPLQSLAAIAARHGITVAALKAANKDYFDKLDDSNRANRTVVEVEEGVELIIPPPPAMTVFADLIHEVQIGETLESISRNWYGTPNNVAVIKAANKEYFDWLAAINKMNKTNVEVEAGEFIVLPGKGLRDPIARHAIRGIETVPVGLNIPTYSEGMYLVKKGDTLSSIAAKLYGTTAGYQILLEANLGKVTNPNNLFVGQWLVVVT